MKLCLVLSIAVPLAAQSLQDFEKKVTEFTLSNGMHFLVIERHEAPVVSFHTYANVGSVDDPGGRTGLASIVTGLLFLMALFVAPLVASIPIANANGTTNPT